ncbi:MAG: bifunctional oligoribonuclease/PAP phosphatase NrnA [Deltaproteobacteria bacterium]|nr:bifunctional oligoribonuclease/PAP phosphatase NrnA [Deltaproteobacteria bacterium]MBW2150372.1 bifunctional oligoribonuclease/PAP phosphatase NrnA [Deltaproteobacteria bacterium]
MDPIIQQLKSSKYVLLASHRNPDGDAIGSLIAMGLCLDALNKNITLYNESPIPAVYRFLPSVNRVVRTFDGPATYDTVVVLDCGDLDRIGALGADTASRVPVVINIDHHSTNKRFGHLQRIDTAACATAEIIYRIIKELSVTITKQMATAIYTGILTDTGSFRFSNTNRAAFAICEEMVCYGVNPYQIAQYVYGTYSLGRIKLLNLALDSIEISENGKISMMTVTRDMLKETGTQPQDADGLINYARGIKDVKVAVLIQEYTDGKINGGFPSRYHVSLRSDGTVDVGAIAASFGGGGHYSASGFNVESDLSELKSKIFALAEKF